MSIMTIAAHLKPWKLQRDRRGYTLLEAVLVVALSSVLVLGLGVLVLSIREQMWVAGQVRAAEEWGNEYTTVWSRLVRNAVSTQIVRNGPPSILKVVVIPPDKPLNERYKEEFTFQYNNGDHVPELRHKNTRTWLFYNDRGINHDSWPPGGGADPRDAFSCYRDGPNGFKIYPCDRPNVKTTFRSQFLTLEFTLVYTRTPSTPGAKRYVREMPFYASAYSVNPNWPIDYLGGGASEVVPEE